MLLYIHIILFFMAIICGYEKHIKAERSEIQSNSKWQTKAQSQVS